MSAPAESVAEQDVAVALDVLERFLGYMPATLAT